MQCKNFFGKSLPSTKKLLQVYKYGGQIVDAAYKLKMLHTYLRWLQYYLDAHNLCILLVLKPEQQQIQRIHDQWPTLGILLSDDADVLLTSRVNGKTLHIQVIHIRLMK